MDIIQTLARELGESAQHVENVVRLLDEGNTIPFIARYRKEMHGANDIIAEWISDDAAVRGSLREMQEKRGTLRPIAATEEDSVYRLYYDFEQPLSRLQGHQILAINRGEKEKMLSATVLLERELALPLLRRAVVKPGSAAMGFVKSAAEDAYDRLIYPSLEREMRALLTERADEGAIGQFALNLKPLLMQPPVKGKVTMGLDPGYRMGCKVAVVDGTGKVLDTAVVYPTHGEKQKNEAIGVGQYQHDMPQKRLDEALSGVVED